MSSMLIFATGEILSRGEILLLNVTLRKAIET